MPSAASSSPPAASSTAPCQQEATTWRECLKQADYGPDLELKACDPQRVKYYACISDWRRTASALNNGPPVPKSFYAPAACADDNDALQRCMQIYMFEVSNCRAEMDRLRLCVTTHEPNAKAFAPKADRDAAPAAPGTTGIAGWWRRITAWK